MTDVADILTAAADLLEPEGAWTKGANARNAGGVVVSLLSPEACSWCARGALTAVTVGQPLGGYWGALQALQRHLQHLGFGNLSAWNDEQPGPEPVVAALRAAAEAAS